MNNVVFICIACINNAAILILMCMRKSKVDSVLFLIFDEVRRAAAARTVADPRRELRVEETSRVCHCGRRRWKSISYFYCRVRKLNPIIHINTVRYCYGNEVGPSFCVIRTGLTMRWTSTYKKSFPESNLNCLFIWSSKQCGLSFTTIEHVRTTNPNWQP